MAKNRTDKCCYKSGYGGGWVTAHQYITELAFAKFAAATLPDKFWTLDKYKKTWGRHAMNVSSLLKIYHSEALINGLRDKRLNKLKSLHAKASFMWKKVFDFYQKKEVAKRKIAEMTEQDLLDLEPLMEKPELKGRTRQSFKKIKSLNELLRDKAQDGKD